MKHFRLNLYLALAVAALSAVAVGFGVSAGWNIGVVVIAAAASAGAICYAGNLVGKLVSDMLLFAKSIEMNDVSTRFPKSCDSRIEALRTSLNKTLKLHRSGMNELETGKLYYDRILRVLTHEMRNGIVPIMSVSADMLSHPDRYAGEKLTEGVSIINEESVSIKKFLDAYHELTHLPRPELKEMDATLYFGRLVRSAEAMAASAGLPPGTVRVTAAEGTAMRIDPDLMRRVIINLVDNAIYAVRNTAEPRIEILAAKSGSRINITVSDNGCGIAAARIDNLFEPFCTTRPGGNGIGLCLCRQIVRLHGGSITVGSRPGRGATFRIEV